MLLNENTIDKLKLVIDNCLNNKIRHDIVKKRINGILHNKTNSNVFKELNNYINSPTPNSTKNKISGNQKNKAVVIVVLALLRRNLDCHKELSALIQKYNFTNCLYGGLCVILSGKSKFISINIDWNDNRFKNKYEFVQRTVDFDYWQYSEILYASKILFFIDNKVFEQLVLKDKTLLLMLGMATYYLDIQPSEMLIEDLILSNDELKQNVGLDFMTRNISACLSNIEHIIKCQNRGHITERNLNEEKKCLEQDVQKCLSLLNECSAGVQAKLLFNYYLINQTLNLCDFAKRLMSSNIQDEFIKLLQDYSKVRDLRQICFFYDLIIKTFSQEKNIKHTQKCKYHLAILKFLIAFIHERKIYAWDETNQIYLKCIIEQLPQKHILALKDFLIKEKRGLMCKKIDRLVRFEIYLKDKRQDEIVENILKIIKLNDNI